MPPELEAPEDDPAPDRAGTSAVPRNAGTGPVTIRTWIASPVLQSLAALALYLAAWLITEALPLVRHPARPQLNQKSMDPNFYTWSMRWWPYAVTHGLNPLRTIEVGAPAGHGLAWVTTIPPLALLLSPVTAVAGPVVSFNLLVAFSLPLSAWAAYVLCRRLTGQFWPALAGGVIYGFSAYEMNHVAAGQLNLTFSLLLPLMAYLVLLWRDEKIGSRVFVGLLALAMVLQFYLFLETFADMTAIWAVALLLGYALAGRSGRPVIARLSQRVGLAYLLTLVLAAPYMAYALTHVPKGFNRTPGKGSLDLASLVIPRPADSFGLSWLTHYAARIPAPSAEGYVGLPLLVLAVALAVFTWSRKITRFLLVMCAFIFVVALGPTLRVDGHLVTGLPWARIWDLPVARSAFPARFMVFAFLALAVMVALWLAGPSRRLWTLGTRWLLVLLVIAAIAADTPPLGLSRGPGLPAFISTGEYRHYLTPGSTVVVVSRRGNAGMLWQAETNFYTRLAGGYINAAINIRTDLPAAVQHLAHVSPYRISRFQAFLRKSGVRTILVEANSAPMWSGVFRKLGFRSQTVGGVVIYRAIPGISTGTDG
jgi:hypothetical protein